MIIAENNLSIFENRSLERLVQRGDIVIKAAQVVKAVEVLATVLCEIGKQAIPAVVGFTIRFIGSVIESVIICYTDVRSRIRQAQIDQACRAFIQSTAAASQYNVELAQILKQVASQDFVRSLAALGITGISMEQALLAAG